MTALGRNSPKADIARLRSHDYARHHVSEVAAMKNLKIVTALSAIFGLYFSPAFGEEGLQEGYAPIPEFRVFGEPANESDSEAISDLMRRFGKAWGTQNVDELIPLYTEDAEWTNAFGDVRRGHDELREQFEWLFKRFESGANDGEKSKKESESTAKPTMKRGAISVRYLGDDAAVYYTYTESNWGVNRDDGNGLRRVYVSYVLQKNNDEWRIAHQTIADARK